MSMTIGGNRVYARFRSNGWRAGKLAVLAALLMHTLASSAWAQKLVKAPEDEGGVIQWIVTAGVVIVIGASAFLNPKRSHLI